MERNRLIHKPDGYTVMQNARTIAWNTCLLIVGSVICTAAVNGILVPKHFLAGGMDILAIIVLKRARYVSERHHWFSPRC